MRPGSFVVGDRRCPRSLAGASGISPAASGVPRLKTSFAKSHKQLAEAPPLTAAQRALWTAAGTRTHRRPGPGESGSTPRDWRPPPCSWPRSD